VQRALTAESAGSLLAGVAGTMPATLFPGAVAAVEVTGAAARSIGVVAGSAFVVLAFLPKALALVLAIPGAVVAAAIAVVMATLFTVGMREVVTSMGTNTRNGLIAGLSFWTGVAFEFDMIFPETFAVFAGGLLSNGLITGGLVAFGLTVLTVRRKSRLRGRLDGSELPRIAEFVQGFAASNGLEAARGRLEAATEEALLVFLTLAASVLVSYVKARAEGLGIECNVGLVTRPERIVLLSAGLISGQVTIFLYIVAAASFVTAAHRFIHAWRQAGAQP